MSPGFIDDKTARLGPNSLVLVLSLSSCHQLLDVILVCVLTHAGYVGYVGYINIERLEKC